jgi:hypothetical protein
MISESQSNYILNISLHVFTLFTFLTVFFFLFVSKLEKKAASDVLINIINKQVNNLLTKTDKWDKKLNGDIYPNIKWGKVNEIAKEVVINAKGELPKIKQSNDRLFKIGMSMIAGLAIFLIAVFIYFKFYRKYKIHGGRIITENLIISMIVGAIEYYFFTRIASKYIIVTPDVVVTTLLERIKGRVSKSLRN